MALKAEKAAAVRRRDATTTGGVGLSADDIRDLLG